MVMVFASTREMELAEPGLASLLTVKKSLEPIAASLAQARITNPACISINSVGVGSRKYVMKGV
jgi:DNA-binding FadR family transcriptional regulator